MCCVFTANVISAWAIAMITSLYVRRGPRLVDISDKFLKKEVVLLDRPTLCICKRQTDFIRVGENAEVFHSVPTF